MDEETKKESSPEVKEEKKVEEAKPKPNSNVVIDPAVGSLLSSMKKEIDLLKKDNDMLKEVADKKRLSSYFSRNPEKLPSIVKVRAINGRVIIGWRTTKDEVREIGKGQWVEDQTMQLVYEDKATERLAYRDFVRRYTTIECKMIGKTEDAEGNLALNLQRLDNGKKYIVGVQYVN